MLQRNYKSGTLRVKRAWTQKNIYAYTYTYIKDYWKTDRYASPDTRSLKTSVCVYTVIKLKLKQEKAACDLSCN